MVFKTQQVAKRGRRIDPHQHRVAGLEDFIVDADEDGGEVVLLVDSLGLGDGAVNDVVHGAERHLIIENIAQQFDHGAARTMADQHQG